MSQGTAKFERLNSVAKEVYDDKDYCAVIAIALMCNVSYGKARAALERAGRKHRKGTRTSEMLAALKEITGKEHKQRILGKPFTMRRAAECVDHDALLLTAGHVVYYNSEAKVVEDWSQQRRHRVVAKVVPEEQIA